MEMTRWVQTNQSFITQYQEWRDEIQEREQELRANKKLVPNVAQGRHSPLLKKHAMKYMTSLTEIKPNETYRLNGDIIKYMRSVERQNMELQLQLNLVLDNLKEADINHQKTLLDQMSLNEKLQQQLIETSRNLKSKEAQHAKETKRLEKDFELMRVQMAQMIETQNDLEQGICNVTAKRKLVQEKISNRQESKDLEDSDNCLLLQTCERIQYLEQSNQKLHTRNKQLEQIEKDSKIELETLWARNSELDQLLSEAKDHEMKIQEQEQEIKELKSRLEACLDNFKEQDEKTLFEENICVQVQGECGNIFSLDCLNLNERGMITESTILTKQSMEFINENGTRERDSAKEYEKQETDSKIDSSDGSEIFEWTPWLKNTTNKAFERDLEGIKAELYDLQKNRDKAFARAKEQTSQTLSLLKGYVPFMSTMF